MLATIEFKIVQLTWQSQKLKQTFGMKLI